MVAEHFSSKRVDRPASRGDGPDDFFAATLFRERPLDGLNLSFHATYASDELLPVQLCVHPYTIPPGVSGVETQ